MSIAGAIDQAIKVAKRNMGDLLVSMTLKVPGSTTYVGGVKTTTYNDVTVEGVPDKFSYHEMQAEDFVQSDLKYVIFNNAAGTLDPKTDCQLVIDGVAYQIRKVDPTKVGGFTVVFTLVLRK